MILKGFSYCNDFKAELKSESARSVMPFHQRQRKLLDLMRKLS